MASTETWCTLCREYSMGQLLCVKCQELLNNEYHPVICLTCRDRFGPHASITWVARRDLDRGTEAALAHMARQSGLAMFAKPTCIKCEVVDETNNDLSPSVPSA